MHFFLFFLKYQEDRLYLIFYKMKKPEKNQRNKNGNQLDDSDVRMQRIIACKRKKSNRRKGKKNPLKILTKFFAKEKRNRSDNRKKLRNENVKTVESWSGGNKRCVQNKLNKQKADHSPPFPCGWNSKTYSPLGSRFL